MTDPTTRFLTKANMVTIAAAMKEAYTNQNAFSGIKYGDTTMSAGSATDTFEFAAGSNITLTAGTKKLTIAATDTTYSAAVPSVSGEGGTDGLITAADQEKLNGIATGAEVNQNAYAGIKYGDTTISAGAKQDTFEFAAGSNVSITADSTNKKLTIAATDTTYSDVTADSTGAAASGLMTSADKAKLDGIEASADVNIIETVKVNGTALTPDANKAVDVTVTAGDSGIGTIKVNGSTVTPYGLGAAAGKGLAAAGVADGETGLVTGDEVYDFVAGQIASVYKPAGTIAASGLVSSLLVAANEGKVYNLSDELTITSANKASFVENAEGTYPAGTNVVIVEVSGAYKFDVLPGFIDLTPYQEISDLGGLTEAEVNEIIDAL